MQYRLLVALVISINLILTNISVSAETTMSADTVRGIGALGRIEPLSRVIKVSHNAALEGANVEQLFFQEADQVEIGNKLALLSNHDRRMAEVDATKMQVKVLEAQWAVEKITLAFNKKEYLRYQTLKQDSMASISLADAKRLAFEQSEVNLKRLSAEIANAKSKQRIAEVELKNTFIYAPINGTVLKILTRPGERIDDNGLLELADLTQLDIVAEVYESDLPKVKVGQKAAINVRGFKQTYYAQVRELGFLVRKNDLNDTDPLADRDNRTIEVRLTLESDAVAALKHHIFQQVYVRIEP